MAASTIIMQLLKKWEDSNIVYCHWKSIDHIAEALSGYTDIDVLLSVDHASKAEEIVLACGFIQMSTAFLRQYPGVLDYIAYDLEHNSFNHLHLHYQLVLGDRWVKSYRLPVETAVLNRRIWLDKYSTWAISPSDELIIFCARMCVKFRHPFNKNNVIKEGKFIASRIDNKRLSLSVEDSYHTDLLKLAEYVLNNGCLNIKQSLVRASKASMKQYRRISEFEFFYISKLRLSYRLFVEFCRRKLRNNSFGRRRLTRGGLVAAFVGMDGSGKTSAISRNSMFFSEQMDIKKVFLGSGRSGAPWYRGIVFSIIGTSAKFKGHKQVNLRGRKNKHYPLYYLLWHRLVIHEKIIGIRKIFRFKSNCGLVFVDRWPQDSVLEYFDGPKFKNIDEKTPLCSMFKKAESNCIGLAKSFPPDLVLRFRVSPVNALSRKPGELSLQMAVKAETDLMLIKWPHHCAVIDINADATIDEVDRQIRKAVWEKISGMST